MSPIRRNISLGISLLLLMGFLLLELHATEEFPVLYKGRFRPAEAYGRLWLYDIAHRQTLKKEDLEQFHASTTSALAFLWQLEFNGRDTYQNAPLFWVGSADLKRWVGLPLLRDRFSFLELQTAASNEYLGEEIERTDLQLSEEWKVLLSVLQAFESIHAAPSSLETAYLVRLSQLQKQGIQPKEISTVLEQEYPLVQRLHAAGNLFYALPSRLKAGDWLPLQALTLKVYQASSNDLQPIGNFTLYPDKEFKAIRGAFLLAQEKASQSPNSAPDLETIGQLASTLKEGYRSIAGKVAQQAHGKSLSYPTLAQLKVEALYVSFPWISLLICLYALAIFLLIASSRFHSIRLSRLSVGAMSVALICHTAVLAMRCYILQRPPVSNMFETVIYVPWVAGCISLLIPASRREPLALISACTASIILLVIVEITGLNQTLDQVQAVLDSNYWLTIHVLLVVGSYGIFILSALLGHLYLGLSLRKQQGGTLMPILSYLILQTLYGGTALLITGTLLGGVWAAESWGRFWDWDPKESWAFISSCIYLAWIHAYRFHRIGPFGLAIGAVSGFLAISFTWYGVNYILGTGLHSYGFGSGGELFYYSFLGAEVLFLSLVLLINTRRQSSKHVSL